MAWIGLVGAEAGQGKANSWQLRLFARALCTDLDKAAHGGLLADAEGAWYRAPAAMPFDAREN